jgi:Mrp family chromosome partitioning ATPase
MGRMLDTLKRRNGNLASPQDGSVPMTDDPAPVAEEPSFIEVGGKQTPIEGSPDVLACPAPMAPGKPFVPQLITPPATPPEPAGLTVLFRPTTAEPAPARTRFAPELIAFHRPDHPLGKQYQHLAVSLISPLPAGRCRALLFTAAHPGAGTTTVLLNLAIALARQGKQRVVVVDANVNQPAIAERLGLPRVPGLVEVLAGESGLQDVLQETGQANLLALTSGHGSASRQGRLGGEAMRALLRQLRERCELILLDAPCWTAQAGLLPLALLCEAVYLVSPETEAQAAETADLMQALAQQGAPLRGHFVTAR